MTYELLVSLNVFYGVTFNILATKNQKIQTKITFWCSTLRPRLQRHLSRIDCACHHAYHVYHSANPTRSWGQTKTLLRPADLRVTLIPVTSIDMSGHCIIDLKIMINSSDQRDRSDQRSQQVSQTNLSINVLHHYFSASEFPNHTPHMTRTPNTSWPR